jgi:eukaryotic-like serine/threonine-protein kinase
MDVLDLRRWPQADRLLEEALALDGAERLAFVRLSAGGDEALRAALEAVLAEAERGDSFLSPGGALSGALAADLGRAEDGADGPRALAPGMSIGGYEILALAGRGGMGEVYKARDGRLGRLVAIKILPDRFARDPERLARFEREARVLASLNHPRIGGIHGIAEDGDTRALVLEWVEGETLADRLVAAALPVREALAIASQIGEALEAAHQRAIIHRDLKPSNIKLTANGVKVLDFGLARAAGASESGAGDAVSSVFARPGLVLGTPAYMSPEQAQGMRVDHRADIWAFGCVLAEMLTGRQAFGGSSAAAVLNRVLEGTPNLERLPPEMPPGVRTLLGRCLERDARRRLGWIGEAVVVLEEALAPAPPPSAADTIRRWWSRTWPVASGLALGAVAALVATPLIERAPPPPVTRLAVPLPEGDTLVAGDLSTVAVSPDGRRIVYRARRGGTMQLFVRALERADPEPIPNSEHAIAPFLSPDGQWVGFSRDGSLVTVPIDGGTPVVVAAVPGAVSAAWLPDGHIIFGGELTQGLQRVRASGGTPEAFTTLDADRGERVHALPERLGSHAYVSFTIWTDDGTEIAVVTLDGTDRRRLGEGRQGRFVPPGHLAFVQQASVWAAPLDVRRMALAGSPGPALDVDVSAVSGNAHFAVSDTGTLAYLPRRSPRSRERQIVWADREGREESAGVAPGPYTRAAVAPDGTRLALAASSPDNRDLWIFTAPRGTLARVTFDDPVDTAPVWTPDGRQLVFRSDRDGGGLFLVGADGAGAPRRLTHSVGTIHTPYEVTRDGQRVLFTEFRTYRDQRIGLVPLDGTGTITWLVDGPSAQLRPRLSPDGRWIAYQSDESGRFEVYVRPFPDVEDGRWPVSTSGGVSPMWGPDGREIFYVNDASLLRVPVTADTTFSPGTPVPLFAVDLPADRLGPVYDLSPDGRRFLFVKMPAAEAAATVGPVLLVQNWQEDLRLRFPR